MNYKIIYLTKNAAWEAVQKEHVLHSLHFFSIVFSV